MIRKIIIVLAAIICIFFFITYIRYGSVLYFFIKPVNIERMVIDRDCDKDGVMDMEDIVEGARKEVENKTKYKDAYYAGGYPPKNEGVCTDVIWRALKNAGYNLKDDMDQDILKNILDYNGVQGKPDPNIDFRRVKNQKVYFRKFAQTLTLEVKPYNEENLKQWQGGDIIVLKDGEHVAIISDKRRRDGIPYIIHNANTIPKEEDKLLSWYKGGRIIGHFRYPN